MGGSGPRHPQLCKSQHPPFDSRECVNACKNQYYAKYNIDPSHNEWIQHTPWRAYDTRTTWKNQYPNHEIKYNTIIQATQIPTHSYHYGAPYNTLSAHYGYRSNVSDSNQILWEQPQQYHNGHFNQLPQNTMYTERAITYSPAMPPQNNHAIYSATHGYNQTIPQPIMTAQNRDKRIELRLHQADSGYQSDGGKNELNGELSFTRMSPQTDFSQVVFRNDQEKYNSATQYSGATISSHSKNNQKNGHMETLSNFVSNAKLEVIQQTAQSFVEKFCPLLGNRPYCFPPVIRHIHQDKQLVIGIESEKRVLGSFEGFIAEHQMPVFMLCHYPLSGFMQVFQEKTENNLDVELVSFSKAKNSKDTITLLLLSNVFAVTIVTVSTLSGNSDLAYIQRGVKKAIVHNKECSVSFSSWLRFLGLRSEVRQVIAFPNLKRSMLHRIRKEKLFGQDYGSQCTLHADDLPAQFEEEWKLEGHKKLFSNWMQKHILCHPPSLSAKELHLLAGALLSPKLSKVDFIDDEKEIQPIIASLRLASVSPEPAKEDASQLLLTFNGMTKPFDEFMEDYVKHYYPDLEEKTYRIPPIHFNIQSIKTVNEYLMEGGNSATNTENKKHSNSQFMPKYPSFVMSPEGHCFLNRNQASNDPQIYDPKSFSLRRNLLTPSPAFLESLRDVDVLLEVMTKDIRADEGENRVIKFFETVGHKLIKPMFIICGYQYNNYLNKLREEMFPKENTSRPVRAFGQTMRAEHDCLIFHKECGVIIVCIKAVGDNFAEWGASPSQITSCIKKILEKAMKQLDREEAMIRHVTSDLKTNLPIHKLIALPNMTRKSIVAVLNEDIVLKNMLKKTLNYEADSGLFLCSDELPEQGNTSWGYYEKPEPEKKLKTWWENIMVVFKDKNGGICPEVYRQLFGRYCGLFSTVEVWSPTSARIEVRNASQAANECADRYRRMILLPPQVHALCSKDRHVYLYGPPGSGKTLILILKAKEWLLSGENVIIINARTASEYGFPYAYGVFEKLKQMIKDLKISQDNLSMINIDSLKFKARLLSDVMPTSCVIMDEITSASHEIIEHLSCLQVKNIWCAGLCIEDKPITANSFTTHKMEVILRCPPILQSLLKETEQDLWYNERYMSNYQCSIYENINKFLQKNEFTLRNSDNKESVTLSKNQNKTAKFDRKKMKKNSLLSNKNSRNDVINSEKTEKSLEDSNLVNERLEHKFGKRIIIKPKLYTKKPFKAPIINTDARNQFLNVPSSDLESLKLDEQKLNYDPESLDERFKIKYGEVCQCQNNTKQQNSLEQQELDRLSKDEENTAAELLNKRLTEKYSKRIAEENELNDCHTIESYIEIDKNSLTEVFSLSNKNEDMEIQTNQDLHKDRESNLTLKYDADSLSKRLENKYARNYVEQKKSQGSNYNKYILPTEGPQPYIIKHNEHISPGNPIECTSCANSVADFLENMVKPEEIIKVNNRNNRGHSLISSSGTGSQGHIGETIIFSNASSIYSRIPFSLGQKPGLSLGPKALRWSDVLIVSWDMPKDCAFISTLRKRNIPVKILMGGKTFEIENFNENKLYVTSCKEVTGLERSLIIFIPSRSQGYENKNLRPSGISDIHLAQSIVNFSEIDRMGLWLVVSRSLSSLVLIAV